ANIDLTWNLTHLLIFQGRHEEATEQIDRLARAGFPRPELDYLRGRILFNREEWLHAAEALSRTYPQLLGTEGRQQDWLAVNLVQECNLLIARCYEQLGDLEAAATAYNRVVTRD